jgi:hypothetical protein
MLVVDKTSISSTLIEIQEDTMPEAGIREQNVPI